MATTPNYASTPTVGGAVLSAANSGSRAAPAGGATVFTPGGTGGQVERIVIGLNGTLAANTTVLLYRVVGGVYFLQKEVPISAVAVAAGTATDTIKLEAVDNPESFPIAMPTGSTLYAALSVAAANGVAVSCEGGSY